MHVEVALPPAILFGLVGVQIIQDDMNLAIRMCGYDFIHEFEKFSSPTATVMPGLHLARHHIQRRKQGGRAMPCIAVAEPIESLAIGQANPALRPLQSLNRGFLVDRYHQGIVRGFKYKPMISAALVANSGSVLIHQLRRRCREIRCFRNTRQTSSSLTLPSARASSPPLQPA